MSTDSNRVRWPVGLAYLALFVLFDWASYIRPMEGLNITPWNPQPALAVALLLRSRRAWGWVWTGLLAADLIVRGPPADGLATLAGTAALTLAYGAIARALALRLDRRLPLATLQELLWFTAIAVSGALFSSVTYVTILAVTGSGPSGPIVEAMARYWIGDGVGLLLTLPILLVALDPRRRHVLVDTLKSGPWWAAAAVTLLLLIFIFGRSQETHFRFFYLLLLPVVWASARLGVAGAVLAAGLTQLGLIVAVQSVPHPDLTVFELQVLMAVLGMTGLSLGVAVDERTRVAAELRGSLRLAAAGQMAAALAHELSQPLTALSSYARACQILVDQPGDLDATRKGRLAEVSGKMVADAHRAGDVVKRLRDFFRSGSAQLQPVSAAAIAQESVEAHRRRADAVGVRLELDAPAGLPATLLDPVQIAVVLRNLIANAIDAASGETPDGRVIVQARLDDGALRFTVLDSGPGLPPARLEAVFEAGPSDKPGGMGIGLSICAAIVEAHGGRLWADAGPGGRFSLTLPLDPEHPLRALDAS